MELEWTARAAIGYENLSPQTKKKADRLLALLRRFPIQAEPLKDKVHKLAAGFSAKQLYIGKVDTKFRAILAIDRDKASIVEIAHHDRLQLFKRGLPGGPQ